MSEAWDLGGLTWRSLGRRVWREMSEDNILGRSAQLSFYFLLALFPILIVVTVLVGRFTGGRIAAYEGLAAFLDAVAPESASRLIGTVFRQIDQGLSGANLAFVLALALWAASSGMVAIMDALNRAYEIAESRPWWRRRLIAIALTAALMLLAVAALAVILQGTRIAQAIAQASGLGGALATLWTLAQWPLALAFVLLVFNLLYLYAPNVRHRRWHWLMPGTMVGVVLWLAAGFAFKLYLSRFGSYNVIYGSLGAVIVLLFWLYLTGIAILIGAQVNSEIELAREPASRLL